MIDSLALPCIQWHVGGHDRGTHAQRIFLKQGTAVARHMYMILVRASSALGSSEGKQKAIGASWCAKGHLVIPDHVDDGVTVPPCGKTLPERGHALIACGFSALFLGRADRPGSVGTGMDRREQGRSVNQQNRNGNATSKTLRNPRCERSRSRFRETNGGVECTVEKQRKQIRRSTQRSTEDHAYVALRHNKAVAAAAAVDTGCSCADVPHYYSMYTTQRAAQLTCT